MAAPKPAQNASTAQPRQSSAPRRLIVLGSTGSIGENTLRVVQHLNEAAVSAGGAPLFEVVGLAAGRKGQRLAEQASAFGVRWAAIDDPTQAATLRAQLSGVEVFSGADASTQMIQASDATDVMAAIVGSAGLPPTLAAIRRGMNIGLANKETLVAAGPLTAPLVRDHRVQVIPVDSEHSAIFQCLQGKPPALGNGQGARGNGDATCLCGAHTSFVRRIVLTASGGPFRTTPKNQMREATVKQALNHPTWNMGPKITIDSATMMNKALEIIEAHWLFGLPAEQIGVIVHPQSVVHSFVEYWDGSVLAQLGPPDMKTPIQYALTYPDRPAGCSDAMDWPKLSSLVFEQPDFDKFPSLKLAYRVIELGGTAGAVLNAANEAAVAAFLDRRIRFGQIVDLAGEALEGVGIEPLHHLDAVLAADRAARAFVEHRLSA